MSRTDNSGRQLDVLTEEAQKHQVESWVAAVDRLIEAVDRSGIDADRKGELLLHMATIRNELASGQWPNVGEAGAVQALAHEAGELEQIAQDWQAMSIRLAEWIKAVSDALGVR